PEPPGDGGILPGRRDDPGGSAGIFPEPEQDAVIQVAAVVQRQGEREPFVRVVFTLGSCAPI
ncbi:DPOD1 polymerase, partial [Crypturellus soui]|nr:DPOD1 polymerase [Crypturellus soui]